MLKVKIEPITGFGKTAEFATITVMHYDLANSSASAMVNLYESNPSPLGPSAPVVQIMTKHLNFTAEDLATWGTDDMVFVDLVLEKAGLVRDTEWTEPQPEVVDPLLHRKYRSIVGCLSYLVNMTRPDLAFSFSQLSKFLQYPGEAHLAAAYRVLAYVKGTLHQGLSWHDPGAGSRNKLSGWVDSDFASDIDTRKSMTGYLMVLNGGPISWKASRQGGVTLSSSEAEFVAASQAGQEVLYLRALLKGFAYLQHGPTEIWEDNASCILMSENPTNRERSRHVDVRVHFLRDMVRDGSVKLIKCAGTQNVADALTKSLPRPAFHKHREFLKGTAQSFSAFFASADKPAEPAYVTKRGSLSFFKAPPMCIGG